jgi:hypothetical protein
MGSKTPLPIRSRPGGGEQARWSAALAALPERLARAAPAFVPEGEPFRTAKCILTYGHYEGVPAVAKLLGPREGPWRWYFERELALYRAFASEAPPVRAPALFAASEVEGALVLERLRGAPLCETRAARGPLPPGSLHALLDSLDRWRAVDLSAPAYASCAIEPSTDVRDALRARLLEDPSAPLRWITDGLAWAARRALLPPSVAELALDALEAHPATRPCHGDLLLRNVLWLEDPEASPRLAWIDWECAGLHAEGWDLGLLWVNVSEQDRDAVASCARSLGNSLAFRAWAACALFACARERLYRSRGRTAPEDVRERSLTGSVEQLGAWLAER